MGKMNAHQAVLDQDKELLNSLLLSGIDINERKNYYGKSGRITPLGLAVEMQNVEIVEFLLEAGAHPEKGSWGFSPLEQAVLDGNINIVKLLLYAGANPNTDLDGDGGTPLSFACAYGHLDIVKALVENGVDVNYYNYKSPGDTAICLAARKQYWEIVDYLKPLTSGHILEELTKIKSQGVDG